MRNDASSSGFNRTFLVLKYCCSEAEILHIALVLIAPFWYWNHAKDVYAYTRQSVLIAPFWYWNDVFYFVYFLDSTSFNRTFLVLKLKIHWTGTSVVAVLIAPFWYWNEQAPNASELALSCFNRTFLVLKSRSRMRKDASNSGFNRTFLVLKWRGREDNKLNDYGFNRTFLVLKSCGFRCGGWGRCRF